MPSREEWISSEYMGRGYSARVPVHVLVEVHQACLVLSAFARPHGP